MQPTSQQAAFLTALMDTTANLALIARAGSGKTSTILMGVNAYAAKHPAHEIMVCAFNKAIADEVAGKLKEAGHVRSNVRAGTIHSLGLGIIRGVYRDIKVDQHKVRNIIDRHQNNATFAEHKQLIAQLVKMAKSEGFGYFSALDIANQSAWLDMADHFDIDLPETELRVAMVVQAARMVFEESLEDTDSVDFDDMILWPLAKDMAVKYGKDLIIVDEAQDLSPAKQELVTRALKRNGRMVVVGDDRQAIYGFSGADAAALTNLVARLKATTLPLSVTWRCPRAVVALAQTLVPDIQPSPTAAEGQVLTWADLALEQVQVTDAVLCRNTAPLVKLAYRLIRSGRPCKVEGRDIGEGLVKLAQRWQVATVDALLNRLDAYLARELAKTKDEAKQEAITDKVQTLVEICNECLTQNKKRVADVVDFISRLFADGVSGVTTLATYHRCKGREWERVILFEHASRCPSPRAKQAWQKAQEDNLAYVAYTRAKQALVFAG